MVIDSQLEKHFQASGVCSNREKRFYYYGTDIPGVEDVRPMRGTPSPTKTAFTPNVTPARLPPSARRSEGRNRAVASSHAEGSRSHTRSQDAGSPRGTAGSPGGRPRDREDEILEDVAGDISMGDGSQ